VDPSETMVVPEEMRYKLLVPVVVKELSTVLVIKVVPEMTAEASEERDSAAEERDARPDEREPAAEDNEFWTSVGTTETVVETSVVRTVVAPLTTVVYGTARTTTLVVALTLVIRIAGLASVVD